MGVIVFSVPHLSPEGIAVTYINAMLFQQLDTRLVHCIADQNILYFQRHTFDLMMG